MEIEICIVCSVVTSIVITKILAIHYFKIVDGYVEDICKKTKEFVDDVKTKVNIHQQSDVQEE